MATKFSRDDRLTILAQVCIDNNINPQQGNYAGLIKRVCLTPPPNGIGISQAAMTELKKSLTTIYFSDRWASLLDPETTEEEVIGTSGLEPNKVDLIYTEPTKICNGIVPNPSNTIAPNLTQDRSALHEAMQQLAQNSHPEPIKKLEDHKSQQPDHLTEKQIAQLFRNAALKDTFDGVGRLILSECRNLADNKHLQIEDVISLWQRFYPATDADWKSNIILIYWDGKDCMRSTRDLKRVVQPAAPLIHPKLQEQGDITEDDDGLETVKGD